MMPRTLTVLLCLAVGLTLAGSSQLATAADSTPHYLITNDDAAGTQVVNTATFYTIGVGGSLTQQAVVQTAGSGIASGFFGSTKVALLHSSKQDCAFLSNAGTGTVASIAISTESLTGIASGSTGDAGTSNGISLATNGKYVFAGYSDSGTIGAFQVGANCRLRFLGDVTAAGLQGGVPDGMAIHGDMMIVTYEDGSMESFNIAAGVPVSNGDEQNSTDFTNSGHIPSQVEITQDGHFAIFGDVATSTVVEVSDISSGVITPTVVYNLGTGISSSNVLLSPDETMLYIVNTQGDKVTAAFFDKTAGTLTKGCSSRALKGYVKYWSYLGAAATATNTGTGSVLYVAEFGAPSTIAVIQVTSSGGTCSLTETAKSPVHDANSPGLLSIAAYPPRTF